MPYRSIERSPYVVLTGRKSRVLSLGIWALLAFLIGLVGLIAAEARAQETSLGSIRIIAPEPSTNADNPATNVDESKIPLTDLQAGLLFVEDATTGERVVDGLEMPASSPQGGGELTFVLPIRRPGTFVLYALFRSGGGLSGESPRSTQIIDRPAPIPSPGGPLRIELTIKVVDGAGVEVETQVVP